jgi:replicative DNA helicase
MKRIFRSIINVKKNGEPTIEYNELVKNYKAFQSSRIKPEDPSFLQIFNWIESYFREYKEVPSLDLLMEKAQSEGSEVILANLQEISIQKPYIRSDYKEILKQKFEEQSIYNFREVLNNTLAAANTGLKIDKKKEIKGIAGAVNYFMGKVREFRLLNDGIKIEGEIRSVEDQKEVVEGYKKRKKDPGTLAGLYTYIDKIDDAFRGIKLGNLFIIAAFVGQGKTTFAINIAYNGIIQGMSGAYVSLEMNYEEMRDMFYVLHCSNPDWYKHPKYKHLAGKISYSKVRYGELNEQEEEFFIVASEDFKNRQDYGKLELIQPSGTLTPSILDMELNDRRIKLAEGGLPMEFAVIDYVGLMAQDKEHRYGDFNVDLNNMIKWLKNFALNFDNGRGLRVITPHQVNREGWKEACKHEGVYQLTALSNANEVERASDGVIALFMTEEMKRHGNVKITCLKDRAGPDFMPFEANLDLAISKRLREAIQMKGSAEAEFESDMLLTDVLGD